MTRVRAGVRGGRPTRSASCVTYGRSEKKPGRLVLGRRTRHKRPRTAHHGSHCVGTGGRTKHVGAYMSAARIAGRTSSGRHNNEIARVERTAIGGFALSDDGGRTENHVDTWVTTARGRTAKRSGGRRTERTSRGVGTGGRNSESRIQGRAR